MLLLYFSYYSSFEVQGSRTRTNINNSNRVSEHVLAILQLDALPRRNSFVVFLISILQELGVFLISITLEDYYLVIIVIFFWSIYSRMHRKMVTTNANAC